MIEELYIMSKFENWTKTGRTHPEQVKLFDQRAHQEFLKFQSQNHLHWIFLGTRSGITAYWRLSSEANEDHIR